MIRPSGRSTYQPGAVPLSFGIAVADGISQACFRFGSGNGRPRRSNRSRSQPSRSGSTAGVSPTQRRDRLASQVVRRRPEAARRHDEVRAPERLAERRGDGREIVRQRGDPTDDDAPPRQVARQVARVRVPRLADGQLRPDRQQLGGTERFHRGEGTGRAERVYGTALVPCTGVPRPPEEPWTTTGRR